MYCQQSNHIRNQFKISVESDKTTSLFKNLLIKIFKNPEIDSEIPLKISNLYQTKNWYISENGLD